MPIYLLVGLFPDPSLMAEDVHVSLHSSYREAVEEFRKELAVIARDAEMDPHDFSQYLEEMERNGKAVIGVWSYEIRKKRMSFH